jgi:hypothetical protein
MNVVAKTKMVISLMNETERKQLFAELQEMGLVSAPEARAMESTKPKRRRSGRRNFWLKTITGWNERKMGGYGIEGDMVWKPADMSPGTLLAACINDGDERHYGIAVVEPASTYTHEGTETITIEGVAMQYGPFKTWDQFKAKAKALGMGVSEDKE